MIGWDIGGVNTKIALVRGGAVVDVRVRPYELQLGARVVGAIHCARLAGYPIEPLAPVESAAGALLLLSDRL